MVHDRRVDGQTFVFGNQGGLFMRAMTWWDHETGSVWSQVWGQAIAGPLKGTTLSLIPASIVPWGTWKAEYPQTLAMINGKQGLFGAEERPRDGWVVGITLGPHSKAYQYQALVEDRVVNDRIGPYPVALYADPETRNVQVFLRQVNDQVLTLSMGDAEKYLVDAETGSQWDLTLGLARNGVLKGETMLKVPYLSSFDWAWEDFHPDTEFYP